MARRRARARAPARRARARPQNQLLNIDFKSNIMSGMYGAGRGYINAVNPLRNAFRGAGAYGDQLAMFTGLQVVKAFSSGEVRRMAQIGQNIESALFGFQFMGNNRMKKTETAEQSEVFG